MDDNGRQVPLWHHDGTKTRRDGKGDAWARMHRTHSPKGSYMQDVDAYMGFTGFAANTADSFFAEFVPDGFDRKHKEVRGFAVVALFDRKSSEHGALGDLNRTSRAFYAWLARELGKSQPVQPKFFYIVGGDQPPWDMLEMDTSDPANVLARHTLTDSNHCWKTVWDVSGLTTLRAELTTWLTRGKDGTEVPKD